MQTNLAETVLDNGILSIEEQIDKLSAEDLLSDEVLTKISEQPSELTRQRLIIRLRERAKLVHVSLKNVENIIQGYKSSYRKKSVEIREQQTTDNSPLWYSGRDIDENLFCESLKQSRNLSCINGTFLDIDGPIPIERMENDIRKLIKPYVKQNVAYRVKCLLSALRITCYCQS